MSSKLNALFLEEDVGERAFEIRVLDLKASQESKQKSFSLMVRKGTKRQDYLSTEQLANTLKEIIRNKGFQP